MLGQDLRNFSGAQFEPLPAGDAGVERTINLMRRLVDDAVKDPQVDLFRLPVSPFKGSEGFFRVWGARYKRRSVQS